MTTPVRTAGGIVGRWFGNAISEATAFAAGIAIGPVLGPPVQALKNNTWSAYPNMPPDPGTLAAGVAQGQVDPAQAATWAKQHGFGDAQFAALVDIANTGPPLGLAYEAWRRGLLSDAEFTTSLKRTGLEDEWDAALRGLKERLLSPQELASMQQQQFIDAARANEEGGLQGWTAERMQLLYEINGLPPGIAQGLEMWRRDIIDQGTFDQIVAEGHTKTKYTPDLEKLKDHVLGHLEYVEARVRGYIDNAAMYAGGALTGYTQEDMDLLHKSHGRPLSWHQVWIGIARGGKLLSPTDDLTAASTGIAPDFFKALQQSSIQQQWYDYAWVQRYTIPAPFVMRLLTTSKVWSQAKVEERLLMSGWIPEDAAEAAAAWSGGTGTTAAQKKQTLTHLTDEYLANVLSRAGLVTALTALGYSPEQIDNEIALAEFGASKTERTRNTKLIEKQFVGAKLSEAQARADLAALGWPAKVQDDKIAAWNIERSIALTTLTVAQIEKALKAGVLTADQATPLLQDLGEDAAAIQTIIASNPPKA